MRLMSREKIRHPINVKRLLGVSNYLSEKSVFKTQEQPLDGQLSHFFMITVCLSN